jgi:transposase
MLAEFGVYIAKGLVRAISFSQGVLAGTKLELTEIAQDVVHNLCGQLNVLHGQVRWYETRLRLEAKRDTRVMLLQTIPGVGPVGAFVMVIVGCNRALLRRREVESSC